MQWVLRALSPGSEVPRLTMCAPVCPLFLYACLSCLGAYSNMGIIVPVIYHIIMVICLKMVEISAPRF
jgi:hypothetical protein